MPDYFLMLVVGIEPTIVIDERFTAALGSQAIPAIHVL